MVYFRSTPLPVTVTTRIITFLVGDPYKPSFATVTGWGVDPRYIYLHLVEFMVNVCKWTSPIECLGSGSDDFERQVVGID